MHINIKTTQQTCWVLCSGYLKDTSSPSCQKHNFISSGLQGHQAVKCLWRLRRGECYHPKPTISELLEALEWRDTGHHLWVQNCFMHSHMDSLQGIECGAASGWAPSAFWLGGKSLSFYLAVLRFWAELAWEHPCIWVLCRAQILVWATFLVTE